MRIICLSTWVALLLTGFPGRTTGKTDAWDRGYELLRESYQLREEGEEEASRERMARALALFRRTVADRTSLSLRPEVDFEIEDSPRGVSLIENRSLLRIEIRTGSSPPRDESPSRDLPADDETLLRLQQLIVQNLARVIQDNAELKASLERLEERSRETETIGDEVSEIREETSGMTELLQTVSDIRDRSDDIYDEVDQLAGDSETLRAVEDLTGEIYDLRDALDLLRDILDLAQDIKDDTEGIRDLESQIDDVKSEVENLQN